ncbi:predicted protein [Sclerotinia sclerotiorum 1980 UF-70]|uniref:Uncharacterized protein n=1 Tax=Sclerotinia sclerotiorum (strain ATCC 18683 / 1980 / Ss-1) TaxID=665079 RepID=A7F684_SCLS1|nr:predicted protein [Sclerotinia sclerotiorum 1980 UF-70]EDN98255.1 predicted protein [Sclerotinia sclerotiorum 1980 UF-70]
MTTNVREILSKDKREMRKIWVAKKVKWIIFDKTTQIRYICHVWRSMDYGDVMGKL